MAIGSVDTSAPWATTQTIDHPFAPTASSSIPSRPDSDRHGSHTSSIHSASRSAPTIYSIPPEILSYAISALASGSPDHPLLDPTPFPTAWELTKKNLLAACSVSKAFNEHAKALLWRDVDVTTGRGWMSVVDALVEEVDIAPSWTDAEKHPEIAWGDLNSPRPLAMDIRRTSLTRKMSRFPGEGELTFSVAPPFEPNSPPSSHTGFLASNPTQSPTTKESSPDSLLLGPALTPTVTRQSGAATPQVRLRSRSRSISQSRSRSPPPGPGLGNFRRALSPEGTPHPRSRLRASFGSQGHARGISAVMDGLTAEEIDFGEEQMNLYLEDEKDEDMAIMEEMEVFRDRFGVGGSERPGGGASTLGDEEGTGMSTGGDWESEHQEWDAPPAVMTAGHYIRNLSFANFRTIGTRRTQEEAVRGKFVTGGRLEGVLKNAPNLVTLGMTEYVDSSLTLPVLTELFFRGYARPKHSFIETPTPIYPHASTNTPSFPAVEYVPYEPETDEEEWDRRAGFSKLEALDLTGCVSRVFGDSLEAFVQGWMVAPEVGEVDGEVVEEEGGRGRSRNPARGRRGRDVDVDVDMEVDRELAGMSLGSRASSSMDVDGQAGSENWEKPVFDGLRRLSLRACTTLSSLAISTLVSSFPNLTHLDLSFTRVPTSALEALGAQPNMRLKALSLAKCTRISSAAIREFLINAPAARTLVDLSLFGDITYTSTLTTEDLEAIIKEAPCFNGKQLRYLDLSSTPITSALLSPETFPSQPALRSFGLAFIPTLELTAVTKFLLKNAPNVEVLTLTSSSIMVDLVPSLTPLQTTMTLHTKLINPLCLPPFSVYGPSADAQAPTRLRVIELGILIRNALGPSGGSKSWRVIKSKGARGWYVDTAAGWVAGDKMEDEEEGVPRFRRNLGEGNWWRRYLQTVEGGGIGWHARKMEVLQGEGMICREHGLYCAAAFAFT